SSNSFNKSPVTLTGSSTLPPLPSSVSPTSVRGELFGDDPLGGRGVAADVEVELDVFFFWAKPKFRIVRGKSLDHLELLRDIYEKDRATGGGCGTAKEKVKQWEREKRSMSIEEIDEMQANNEVFLEIFAANDESNPTQSNGPTSLATSASKSSSSSSKKKPRLNDELSEEIKEVSSVMKQVANAILTTNRRVWTEEEMFEAMGRLGLKGMALCDAVGFCAD
ncbi:hypothetical protein Tsubulata_004706, partial [Turnera subulata]